MTETLLHGRRAASLENEHLKVTVVKEGGHIAEILDKRTGLNPLWTPSWPSIDPSTWDPAKHRELYGSDAEGKLLCGILGHNLCLDIFGGPSEEEAAAGLTAHGEGSVAAYKIGGTDNQLILQADFPLAQLRFERRVELRNRAVRIAERVENLSGTDKTIGWTQHVTLSQPFLERGVTQFRASATRSKVFESEFGTDAYLTTGAEFDWPVAPRKDGGAEDLRVFNKAAVSSGYTAHVMDQGRDSAYFVAYSPAKKLAFGYVWKRADFPWMGIWEENHSRKHSPWNGNTLTRGMEFGVSPMPESRRDMVARGSMFGVSTYRWIPARSSLETTYWAVTQTAGAIPETLEWPE